MATFDPLFATSSPCPSCGASGGFAPEIAPGADPEWWWDVLSCQVCNGVGALFEVTPPNAEPEQNPRECEW